MVDLRETSRHVEQLGEESKRLVGEAREHVHRDADGVGAGTSGHPHGLAAIELMANQVAVIATRTVYAAIVGEKGLLAELDQQGKLTPELRALMDDKVPEDVRVWVRAQFWAHPGPGIDPSDPTTMVPTVATTPVQKAIASMFKLLMHRIQETSLHEPESAARGLACSIDEFALAFSHGSSVHCNPLCGGGGAGGGSGGG